MFNIVILLLCVVTHQMVQEYSCDIDINDKVCLEDSGMEISRPWVDPTCYGQWSFDYDQWIDQSSYKHVTNVDGVEATFSLNGFGVAALFTKSSLFEAYLVPPLPIQNSTITMILYFDDLIRVSTKGADSQCGLLLLSEHVNEHDEAQKQVRFGIDAVNRTFILQHQRETGESVIYASRMRVQPQMWYRIYIVYTDTVNLYVNGFLEIQARMRYDTLIRHLAILGTKNQPKCPISFIIDSLQLYTSPQSKSFIQAASHQFNSYSDQVFVGCQDCQYSKAKVCPGGFHICSTLELYAFAISVAKDMAWVPSNQANFWSQDTNIDTVESSQLGTGLCCRNIDYA